MASTTQRRSATANRRKFVPGAKEKLLALLSTTAPTHEDSTAAATAASSPELLWSGVLAVVLESAYKQRDWGLAVALVTGGARIGALDLHLAVEEDQDELAAALLENGAPADAEDYMAGETPLHVAARQGNGAMAELLLHKGANVDSEAVGCTPLFVAAGRGSVDVVRVLMAAGADSGVRDDTSPLILAADKGNVDVLKKIIELGADVNAAGLDGWTALHSATGTTVVDVLIGAGANIEARDAEGDTALNYLAQYHAIAPMRALVSHGADPNTQNESGDAPLHFAARAAGDEGAAELVDFLLRSGADETIVNRNNETAADVVGHREHEDDTDESMEQVRRLLADAPADRAWRRRGLLLLCIARCRRNQPPDAASTSINPDADDQEPNRIGSVSSSIVEERGDGEWDLFAAWWMIELLQGKEGIFRAIVGFV